MRLRQIVSQCQRLNYFISLLVNIFPFYYEDIGLFLGYFSRRSIGLNKKYSRITPPIFIPFHRKSIILLANWCNCRNGSHLILYTDFLCIREMTCLKDLHINSQIIDYTFHSSFPSSPHLRIRRRKKMKQKKNQQIDSTL